MSLPVEDIVSAGELIVGLDLLPPPRDLLPITPRPGAIARLQRLHAAAADLAEDAPEGIANPYAGRGFDQALIDAMVGCHGRRERRENSLARGQHAIVMRRFCNMVEGNRGEPLYIPGPLRCCDACI